MAKVEKRATRFDMEQKNGLNKIVSIINSVQKVQIKMFSWDILDIFIPRRCNIPLRLPVESKKKTKLNINYILLLKHNKKMF